MLDVGCGCDGRSFEAYVASDFNIVGIDLFEPEDVKIKHPGFKYYKQNAADMWLFGDKAFDLAVSIGMMEHICNRPVLNEMAREIERVAKQWVIVVPWRYGFIEPHFKFPFFPLLPNGIQIGIAKQLNLHNLAKKIRDDSSYISNHYQWLSTQEWVDIFKADGAYVLPPLFDALVMVKRD